MGIAWSNRPTAWVYFDGSTTAGLIAGIGSALQATGWDSSLNATSPQGLTIQALLTTISSTQVGVQIKSSSGTSVVHRLGVASGYQIWSNCCSFFISQVGVRHDTHGSVVVAGIPWTPPASCSGGPNDAQSATEAWYSFGDYDPAGGYSATPRIRLLLCDNLSVHSPEASLLFPGTYNDAMWNASYCQTYRDYNTAHPGSGSAWEGNPEILTVQEADDCMRGSATYDNQTLRYAGYDSFGRTISPCPIVYDPLLVWGDTYSVVSKIRGQIYDALIVSRSHLGDSNDPAEPVITTPDTATFHWRNFTDQYYWGSLWLMIPATGPAAGNVAF